METRPRWIELLLRPHPKAARWIRLLCASGLLVFSYLLCAGSGPISRLLQRASYDWLYKLSFLKPPDISHDGVAIVYVDELSQTMFQQPRNRPWDRALYAQLLDRLRQEGAKAVVLDVIFSGPSNPRSDSDLARSIGENGRVVLGVDMATASEDTANAARGQFGTLVFPDEPFAKASARLGLVHLKADEDFIVREHFHLTPMDGLASLSWAAADLAGLPVTQNPNLARERWLRYYGGPETIPHVSFYQALREPNFPRPGFFKNKVVFVGARPTATLLVERRDEFRSSFNSWNDRFLFMPAVEVHATMYLNLLRQDWLRRTAPAIELALAAAYSALIFLALGRLKPATATLGALFLAGAMTVGSILLFHFGWWSPWLVFLFVHVPAGLLLCIMYSSFEWLVQRHAFRENEKIQRERIREQAALLDKTHDAIIVHDLEWKPVFWNKGADRTYGWNEKEAAERCLDELLARKSAAMQTAQSETLKSGEWTGEMTHYTRAGKEIIVHSRWSLLRSESGAPKAILTINSDVTEHRQLEAQLLRSQRLDSLGTLAGGIAHDLNNVLSPILMGVEIVRMKLKDASANKILDTIENSAQRGAALVKQVLTFARGVEGEHKIIQVRHLLKEMDKILAETFPKNINISIQIAPGLHTVKADLTQLHQVLLNLCVNARDAMPQGGQLKIEAANCPDLPPLLRKTAPQTSGDFILIKVADTGEGIPPEIAEKIFEPFFTTKEIGKGTGLGLATVASILRKHNGCLDFKSVVGQGTEFLIYLPAALDGEAESTDSTEKKTLTGRGELVLVVDDEPSIRATLEEMLTTSNYQVISASHAQAALEIVADSGSSLAAVVMDRMMPGLDALRAMEHMKMLHPALPIVCMSGLAPKDPKALEKVTDGFLSKPFTREKLLTMLQTLPRHGRQEAKGQNPDCPPPVRLES